MRVRRSNSSSNGCSLRDIDTVQELSVVLISDLAHLGYLSARKREVLVVNTLEDDLVLKVRVESSGGAWEQVKLLGLLSAQEVLDFNGLSILGDDNINGEMSVNESHSVSVRLQSLLIIII